jgi:dipeptidyl aminopeptidase/acylaminoacyl peptidase
MEIGIKQITLLIAVPVLWGIIMTAFREYGVISATTELGLTVARAKERSEPVLTKRQVQGLQSIPDSARIILSAPWAGTKTAEGFPVNELYVMDVKGENIRRITHNGHLYNHFAVSPDRKMIAAIRFTGDTNRDGRINFLDRKTLWVIDLKSREEWPLLSQWDAGWGGVDWSPDGKYLYLSILMNNESDIYRIRPDGTDLKNITRGIERALGSEKRGKWCSDVSISFDGEWIAFLYSPRVGEGPFSFRKKNVIAICRVDGSDPRIVTNGGSLPPGMYGPWGAGDFDPEFSPDGQHITFQRVTNRRMNWGIASHDIMVVRIDGTGLRCLSPEKNLGIHGISDWSWDNLILFSEWNQADGYIGPVVVKADGSNYRRILKARGGGWARWMPPTRGRFSRPRERD